MNSEKLDESSPPAIPKAEVVMKICLLVSVVLGVLLIVFAVAERRNILDVAGTAISLVALQWIFFVLARAQKIRG